jgi:ribosomal protein S18 acetylase RimI-like enzyme
VLTARDATTEDFRAARDFWVAFGTDQPPPDEATWNARYREHILFLVDDTGERVGYAMCLPYGSLGDIRHIMLAPAWRGKGIGKQLMDAVRIKLRGAGCTNWRLEVRDDNAAGVALYRSAAMHVEHALITLRMTRALAETFAATRSGTLAVAEVLAHDDLALEHHFDLGQGFLARSRGVASSVLWRIGDDTLAHYRVELAPSLSLLFPFRFATPDHAATIVEAAVARGMQVELEMLVTGDASAVPLEVAGARRLERMLQMGGAL